MCWWLARASETPLLSHSHRVWWVLYPSVTAQPVARPVILSAGPLPTHAYTHTHTLEFHTHNGLPSSSPQPLLFPNLNPILTSTICSMHVHFLNFYKQKSNMLDTLCSLLSV